MLQHIKELIKYRELLYAITRREIVVRYKQSILGISWAILQPLAMVLIYTLIFSKFIKIPSDGIPYPIFTFSALLPWSLFASSLGKSTASLVSNTALISQIYLPREIFPLAAILASLVDFMIASIMFIVLMFFYQIPITINILFTVVILVIQIIFTLGLALFTSTLNVYYRDIGPVISLILGIWFYLTPVIYPISVVPETFRTIYMLNPMVVIIDGYRKVIIQGIPPDLPYLGLVAAAAIILLVISYKFFNYMERTFADII